MQMCLSLSQNAIVGLAPHRFWNPQRKLISCQHFIDLYVRRLSFIFSKSKFSVSVSMFEIDDGLRFSLNFWDQFIKSRSQSQYLIPILKVSVSVSKIETGYNESQSQHAKTGLAHPCIHPTLHVVCDVSYELVIKMSSAVYVMNLYVRNQTVSAPLSSTRMLTICHLCLQLGWYLWYLQDIDSYCFVHS